MDVTTPAGRQRVLKTTSYITNHQKPWLHKPSKRQSELRPPIPFCAIISLFLFVKNVTLNYETPTVYLQGKSTTRRSSSSTTFPLSSQHHLPSNHPRPQQHNPAAAWFVPHLWALCFVPQWSRLKSQDGKMRHLHQHRRFSQELGYTLICIPRKRTFGTKGESSGLHYWSSSQILVHQSTLPPGIPCIFNV